MGFFDELVKNAALWSAVQVSKGRNGKPDPYKAAGIATGMGNFSARDRAKLGAMLGEMIVKMVLNMESMPKIMKQLKNMKKLLN